MSADKQDGSGGDSMDEFKRLLEAMRNPATMANPEQTEAVAADLLKEAEKYAQEHPSSDADLHEELEQLELARDWEAIIAVRTRLIQRCADRGEFHSVYLRESEQGSLLSLLGRLGEARECRRRATVAAKQTDVLTVSAFCHLKRLETDIAVRLLREAVELRHKVLQGAMGATLVPLSRLALSLRHLAEALEAAGDVREAETVRESSENLIADLGLPQLPDYS